MRCELAKTKFIFSAEEALAIAKIEDIRDEIEDQGIDSTDVTNGLYCLVKSKNNRIEYDNFIIEIKD